MTRSAQDIATEALKKAGIEITAPVPRLSPYDKAHFLFEGIVSARNQMSEKFGVHYPSSNREKYGDYFIFDTTLKNGPEFKIHMDDGTVLLDDKPQKGHEEALRAAVLQIAGLFKNDSVSNKHTVRSLTHKQVQAKMHGP